MTKRQIIRKTVMVCKTWNLHSRNMQGMSERHGRRVGASSKDSGSIVGTRSGQHRGKPGILGRKKVVFITVHVLLDAIFWSSLFHIKTKNSE